MVQKPSKEQHHWPRAQGKESFFQLNVAPIPTLPEMLTRNLTSFSPAISAHMYIFAFHPFWLAGDRVSGNWHSIKQERTPGSNQKAPPTTFHLHQLCPPQLPLSTSCHFFHRASSSSYCSKMKSLAHYPPSLVSNSRHLIEIYSLLASVGLAS